MPSNKTRALIDRPNWMSAFHQTKDAKEEFGSWKRKYFGHVEVEYPSRSSSRLMAMQLWINCERRKVVIMSALDALGSCLTVEFPTSRRQVIPLQD